MQSFFCQSGICDGCGEKINHYYSYLMELSTRKMYCFDCTWGREVRLEKLIAELGVDKFNKLYYYYTDG